MGVREAEKPEGSSLYFQILIVRSRPDETIWEDEMNLADFMEDVWPPLLDDGEVTSTSDERFQTLKSPS